MNSSKLDYLSEPQTPQVENANGARTIFKEGDARMECDNASTMLSMAQGT